MDLERYGDYNDFDQPKKKGMFGRVVKWLILLTCLTVIGVLAFRMILFNYYPDDMKRTYYDQSLKQYYNLGGKISIKTQELRAPYDDPNDGNFMCDNLLVIEEAGNLQVSLRYNNVLADQLKKEGVTLDKNPATRFRFRLVRDPVDNNSSTKVEYEPIGRFSACLTDEFLMYTYYKLVFSDVDFEGVEWIALEVFIDGVEEPYRIAIYENNSNYHKFDVIS